ncbi:MAG: MBL fold metallo-hydrolase [Saprospiraceae bacterium]|nr:MBL fold metallo-hydrolase [Saprospiraceae bacterium]
MTKYFGILFLYLSVIVGAQDPKSSVLVLGISQDGGYPHMACRKACCNNAWNSDSLKQYIVSLAIVDWKTNEWWLIEATPDIARQIHLFQELTQGQFPYMPQGIFITHAHIGHYSGLMQLGREVLNSSKMPVYVLPKMKAFLEQNGPWSQLVKLENIQIVSLNAGEEKLVSQDNSITPFLVPHRDEYSETAGFRIKCGSRDYLFIPDIDKWEKWEMGIVEEIKKSDVAFIDATFYHEGELTNRSLEEIPHPLVVETVKLFEKEEAKHKEKIKFIHFNHTNPLLWSTDLQNHIKSLGFHITIQGQWY